MYILDLTARLSCIKIRSILTDKSEKTCFGNILAHLLSSWASFEWGITGRVGV